MVTNKRLSPMVGYQCQYSISMGFHEMHACMRGVVDKMQAVVMTCELLSWHASGCHDMRAVVMTCKYSPQVRLTKSLKLMLQPSFIPPVPTTGCSQNLPILALSFWLHLHVVLLDLLGNIIPWPLGNNIQDNKEQVRFSALLVSNSIELA